MVWIAGELRNNWQQIKLDAFRTQANGGTREFFIDVSLGLISHEEVQVELYADALNGQGAEKITMECGEGLPGDNRFLYHARVGTARPPGDYTVRARPRYEKISVPLENNLILWQR